jgi:hypothetical protein
MAFTFSMTWLVALSTCPLIWTLILFQSTVKPQEKNKNSDKIETLQNKTKDITEEEAKGKTDSQDMPNNIITLIIND